MLVKSKEHYDLMSSFERIFCNERLDKEDKKLWAKCNVYQSGEVNKLFLAFRFGYSTGKQEHQQ